MLRTPVQLRHSRRTQLLTPPRAWLSTRLDWRYVAAGKCDLRLDLLRGLAVFAMVVDHTGGPSWLYALTGGNRFFVSAAEAFVFISGVVAGIVYGGRMRARGWRAVVPQLLQRAWLLYVLAVWLALGSATLDALLGGRRSTALVEAPAPFIWQVITLQRTYYLVDVMLLYGLLMLLAPLALALLARGRWWLLGLGSLALWGTAQLGPETLSLPWPIVDNPVFALASWQIIFTAGLTLGFERERLARSPALARLRGRLGLTWAPPLVLLLGALVWLHATDGAALGAVMSGDPAAALDGWFDKQSLPLPRLLASVVVFALAWLLVSRAWRPLRAGLGWLLLPLGQGALYAYAAHLFLVPLLQAGLALAWGTDLAAGPPPLHPGLNALVQLGGMAALWSLTRARVLGSALAPLARLPLPSAGRPRWRLRDGLGLALIALLSLGSLGAGWPLEPGTRPDGSGLAAPVATVTAPRRIAGSASGSAAIASAALGSQPSQHHALLAASTGEPAGWLNDGSVFSPALGRELPFGIYLPPGYEAGTGRYPVLYMLHGIGGHYSEWIDFGLAERAEELIVSGQLPPLIVVLPQGDQGYWVNQLGPEGERWGDYLAGDLVDYIDATYRTLPSPASRAVGGLSMGGFGALSLGLTQPDVFGVVGAHSPSLHAADTAPPFLVGDDPAAYQAVDPFALAERVDSAATPRVWIDVGDADLWLGRGEELYQALDRCGLAVDYVVTPGDHDDAYWSAQAASYLRFYGSALRGE